jgi:hypothetical protein
MNTWIQKNHRLLFYGSWILLSILQAALTELQDDEAYYWVYSHFLDWGYFDHPPMTGLLVKIGYTIFPNELGVRLLPLLLTTCSLLIIEKLTSPKNPLLFYTIALSIAVLQLSGFVAVPDNPLIFFTALFFLCYQRFLTTTSLLNTLWLAIAVALLLYSKYHAVLIVFFTLLSNLKLFTRYQTWVAGLLALVLFAPHLWWQYQHDWVSFKYHLFESNVNAYKVSFTLDYIVGQLLLPGPIAGFILLPAALLYRSKNSFDRALKFTMAGIYLFFLLSSFRGKVEGNWTSPALVPLIILAHRYLSEKLRWQKFLYRLLPLTLLLVFFARIVMVADFLPVKTVKERYHSWKQWPQEMKERTQDLPVVFSNSYQRASKYWFYSGQPTYSLNHYRERKNNYNLWPLEDSLLGKPVYFLDKYELWRFPDSLQTPIGWMGYRYDSNFISFAKVRINVLPKDLKMKTGETINLQFSYTIPEHYLRFIHATPDLNDSTRIGLFNSKGWIKDAFTGISLKGVKPDSLISFRFSPGLQKGNYYLRFSINSGNWNPTHNSDKIKLQID